MMTTSPRSFRLVLAAQAIALLAGCGDNQPASLEVTYRPVPGCEAIDHTPCDVRAMQCQTHLFALAACLRGDQADAAAVPPIAVVPEADFGAMLAADAAMATPDPHLARWDWALSSLALIAPGGLSAQATTAEDAKLILGVYRPDTKDILIIDHGAEFDERAASPVLVHEMVHALQDREVDLAQFRTAHTGSQDSALAVTSLVEGEARMHETRYRASVLGLDPAQVDWMRRFASSVAVDQAYLLMQPSPLTASTRAFPYEWGARYVYYTWTAGGMQAVHARFLSPPVTTRLLMASVQQALDAEPAPGTLPPPSPPAGWAAGDGSALGAWALFLMLARSAPADLQGAQDVALAWRGDGFWIYDGPAGDGAFVWRIDLADAGTADRVVALSSSLGLANLRRVGTRVVLAKATDFQSLDWAFAP